MSHLLPAPRRTFRHSNYLGRPGVNPGRSNNQRFFGVGPGSEVLCGATSRGAVVANAWTTAFVCGVEDGAAAIGRLSFAPIAIGVSDRPCQLTEGELPRT